MNASLSIAVLSLVTSIAGQGTTLAANVSPGGSERLAQTAPQAAVQSPGPMDKPKPVPDHERCKKYVQEHRGHPGKGTHPVKVVYVDCPEKR